MDLKMKMQVAGMRKLYNYIDKDPENNILKALNTVERFVPSGTLDGQIEAIRESVGNSENNWYQLIQSIFTEIDDDVRRTLFENLVINATVRHKPIREALVEKYDCNVPWAILMDPTSACNLKCTGCWAADYGNKLNLSYEELDDIIRQAKKMGIYMFIYSGGEPLVRKKDIIRLCEAHPDCEFLSFTNGTLIDEQFADDMLRVKNFIPAISVEGFEEDTDFRRGDGTFAAVERAMEILKRKKLPFGISCCYTSRNVDMIGSEEYFDQMIAWGAKFCWFFTYMPIGHDAVPSLMATAEQRAFMYERIREFRQSKPIFTLDFWNDGETTSGCIAGGREYLHINANGDIEPCAFIHYSDSNIREKTLLEAFQAPLFKAYRAGQPFNDNHLRPCPLLDNPGALTEMVEKSGARSTDLQNPENVRELSAKCFDAAGKWAVTADEIWECAHSCATCAGSHAGKGVR